MTVEMVQQIYDAMARADLDAVLAHCHPDVEITQDAALPWGGRFVGAEGVTDFALKLVGAIESRVTIEAIYEAGDEVVQYGRTKGTVRETGTAFDIAECHVWTIREGRVAAAHFMIDTPAMLAALGA